MGTVFNQPLRDNYKVSMSTVDGFLEDAVALAKKHKISISDVIEAYKALDHTRKNNLYRSNGDIHDEQIAGLAELIKEISGSLQLIAERNKL